MKSYFRNVFRVSDEDEQWQTVLNQFSNKVPSFASKAEALDFTKQHCKIGSNPDYDGLQHSISTLIDFDQINKYLVPKLKEYYFQFPSTNDDVDRDNNKFVSAQSASTDQKEHSAHSIYEYLHSRLSLSIHENMTFQSTMNTLHYMFFHMKCGIFVMIRNNEVVIFCPFVNKDYKNTWGDALNSVQSSDGSIESYYEEKAHNNRRESYLRDTSQWWANGNIICNEYKSDDDTNQFWGDHFLFQLKDMFAEVCRCRAVPDCEFFVNKRDYPHLKFNTDIAGGIPVEPYGFIFGKDDRDPSQDLPLPGDRHFTSYAPIMSFYSSSRFADIPIPPSEDWEAASGRVFPASFIHSTNQRGELEVQAPRDLFTPDNLAKFERTWEDKVNTAFFRGTATGGGVTVETNQRLHLAQISHEWSKSSSYRGTSSSGAAVPYLDAKITGWNMRDKKIATEKMTYLHKEDFEFSGDKKLNFVEIYKQSTYKYLVYVEGHCAACRYGFMMRLGSVILKVDSQCVADQMWYFPLLVPFEDHVPVKADLSDLLEKLQWCHENDEKCRRIAARAQELYHEYVSREGILDYLQLVCGEIAKRYHRPPLWAREPSDVRPAPQLSDKRYDPSSMRYCCEDAQNDINALCSYCEEKKRQELSIERQKKAFAYNSQMGNNHNSSFQDTTTAGNFGKVKIVTEDERKKERNRELKERKHRLAEEERAAKRAKVKQQTS